MTEKRFSIDKVFELMNGQFNHCFLLYSENMSAGEKLLYEAIKKNVIGGVISKMELLEENGDDIE